jgi:hypothetical protein
VVTLDQVKDALAKVAAHPLCSEKMANRFAINSGGAVRGDNWDSIQPKKFERVLRKCESAIKEADEAEHLIEITAQRKDDLDVVGKQITSLADKIKREAEAELKHKAEGDSFFQHLAEKLKEAEPLAKAAGITMKALKLKYVGDRLGDTRFKLALRIARGLITHQQATAADTKVTREKRAVAEAKAAEWCKANSVPSDTMKPVVRGPDGKPLDTSGFVGNAKAQLAAEIAKANGTVVEPEEPNLEQAAQQNANKTGRDTMVIHDDGQTTMVHPQPPAEPVAPRVLSAEDVSDGHLLAFKKACDAHYSTEMLTGDRAKARVYLTKLTDNLVKLDRRAA